MQVNDWLDRPTPRSRELGKVAPWRPPTGKSYSLAEGTCDVFGMSELSARPSLQCDTLLLSDSYMVFRDLMNRRRIFWQMEEDNIQDLDEGS